MSECHAIDWLHTWQQNIIGDCDWLTEYTYNGVHYYRQLWLVDEVLKNVILLATVIAWSQNNNRLLTDIGIDCLHIDSILLATLFDWLHNDDTVLSVIDWLLLTNAYQLHLLDYMLTTQLCSDKWHIEI